MSEELALEKVFVCSKALVLTIDGALTTKL